MAMPGAILLAVLLVQVLPWSSVTVAARFVPAVVSHERSSVGRRLSDELGESNATPVNEVTPVLQTLC